jgi:hypothetical protein
MRFSAVAFVAGVYLVILVLIGLTDWSVNHTTEVVLLGIATGIFGAGVAWAEIVTVFRDEPLKALAIPPALAYAAGNAFVSFVTFGILVRYQESLVPLMDGDLVLLSVAAGFSAMLFLRSKLFTFRGDDGKEYAVGPALAVDAILRMLATEVDRQRALQRQRAVTAAMQNVEASEESSYHLIESLVSALSALQSLKADELEATALVLRTHMQIEDVQQRMTQVGFAALTIFGEKNFNHAMDTIRAQAALRSAATLPTTAPIDTSAERPPAQ